VTRVAKFIITLSFFSTYAIVVLLGVRCRKRNGRGKKKKENGGTPVRRYRCGLWHGLSRFASQQVGEGVSEAEAGREGRVGRGMAKRWTQDFPKS